jgi:rod shape determining protein RodA
LTVIGIVSVAISYKNHNSILYKEFINIVLSVAFFFAGGNFYYLMQRKSIRLGSYLMMILALIILITPLGSTINGVRSWINFGSISIQPIEYMKIILVYIVAYEVILSELWTRSLLYRIVVGTLLLFSMWYTASAVGDLGSTVILFGIASVMYMTAFMDIKGIFASIASAFILLIVAIKFHLLKSHQIDRLKVLVNPSDTNNDASYNIRQIEIGIGNGGLFGKLNHMDTLTYRQLIPEQHTDFIFSVIGENFGFFGCIFYITIMFLFILQLLKLTRKIPAIQDKVLLFGFLAWVSIQFICNVGMNLSLTPIMGVPLPFISYGGSSLSALWFMIGVIIEMINNSKSQIGRYGLPRYLF